MGRQGQVTGMAVLFVLAVAFGPALWAQADPFIGVWKVDVAKSTYSPGPAPKSQTVTYEAVGKGMKVTSATINADGSKTSSVFTSDLDGKDVPLTGGSLNADAVSFKRLDDRRTERIDKKGGKVLMTYRSVVSADGKTRTSTQTGTNPKGEAVNNIVFYVKQ